MIRALLLILILPPMIHAQERRPVAPEFPDGEIFVGYSMHGRDHVSGWNVSGAGNLNSWLSMVGDMSAHYLTVGQVLPIHGTLFTGSFGPRVSWRNPSRFIPFGQLLIGGSRLTASNLIARESTGGGMVSTGGGLDLNVSPHIGLRLVQWEWRQIHYQSTRLSGDRTSMGLVVKF